MAMIFAATTMTADFAGALLPTTDSVGNTVAAVVSDGPSGDSAEAAGAGPSCQLSESGPVAMGSCQLEKHTGRPLACMKEQVGRCYTQSQAPSLSGFVVGLLDRPPNRPPR